MPTSHCTMLSLSAAIKMPNVLTPLVVALIWYCTPGFTKMVLFPSPREDCSTKPIR